MRGVGQEVLLRTHRLVQPGQQVIDGTHQGRHLFGRLAFVDRTQVIAVAQADALLKFVQRHHAARQCQPQHQHRHRLKHKQRQHHAAKDFAGQA